MKKICLLPLLFFIINCYSQENKERCNDISVNDKEANKYYFTPLSEKLSIMKVVSSSDTTYYLNAKATGNILAENPKGFYLLMENDRKIEDEDIEISVKRNDDKELDDSPYLYEALVKIEPIHVIWLAIHKVIGYKAYIFQGIITSDETQKLKDYSMCIFSKK